MSKLARDHRNSDVIKIQIAKKELNLPDDEYRAILVAVEINLQHDGGVVRRAACCRWDGSFKSQRHHVQLAYEGVHYPNRVVIRYEIVQTLRQQSDLASVLTLYESGHIELSTQFDMS